MWLKHKPAIAALTWTGCPGHRSCGLRKSAPCRPQLILCITLIDPVMHSSFEQPRVPSEPLPISSGNSGVSDSGAIESADSEFVVAGSPGPAIGADKGDNFDPGALATDLLQEVARQVERPACAVIAPALSLGMP